MSDCVGTWNKCLEYIEQEITVSIYKTWFAPIAPISLDNASEKQVLTLEVPSMYFVQTLENKYLEIMRRAIRTVLGPSACLKYRLSQQNSAPRPQPVAQAAPTQSGGYAPLSTDVPINPFEVVGRRHSNIDPQLNMNFTFDNYIEGTCNKLAHTVAKSVAERPGSTAFNPLFIFGHSGVGKTHLIQAIGAEVKQRNPDKNVIYLSANRFMRQYVDATKSNQISGFMNFYQMIDVLIVDDIQELAGRSGTENVFFQIFNFLQQNNKQIVIAADKKPSEITGMEDRLLSRFKAGVVAEISVPDYQTRLRIIENKIEKDGIQMPEDVVRYIANNVTDNVRELEGSLVSLLARAAVEHCDITMDIAREVVSCMVKKEVREITVDYIMEVVCEHYGIDVAVLQQKTRKREVVLARQIVMFLCKELTSSSLSTIGAKLGNKNHSTVLYSCKVVSDLVETNKDFEKNIRQIESKIQG